MARTQSKITEIYVEILNWEKYNQRKDVKHPSWFRFSHSLFEDPQFFEFTHTDIVVWIYLLCLASRKSTNSVTIFTAHAERIARITLKDLASALQKLNEINVITFKYVTRPIRGRGTRDTDTGPTLQTRHNITLQDITSHDSARTPSAREVSIKSGLHPLAELWNQLAHEKFPRVVTTCGSGSRGKKCKQRWEENPDPKYWQSLIEKINGSNFCKGTVGDRGWVANFDWFISPHTNVKISEGMYDNRGIQAVNNGKASNGRWLTPDEKKRQNTESAVLEAINDLSNGQGDSHG